MNTLVWTETHLNYDHAEAGVLCGQSSDTWPSDAVFTYEITAKWAGPADVDDGGYFSDFDVSLVCRGTSEWDGGTDIRSHAEQRAYEHFRGYPIPGAVFTEA